MADIGQHLDTMPLNCVLFVLSAANPRIDRTLKRLIEIVIHKVHKRDYGKLGLVINHYKHDSGARGERAEFSGKSEQESKQAIRDDIAASLTGEGTIQSCKIPDQLIMSNIC